MKRFLIKLGITFAALLAIAYGLDGLITHNLKHSDARMVHTYNAILYDSLQCNALIMGSSRGQVQYSPRIIDSLTGLNSYNISVDGRCIDAEVTMYNFYRRHCPKPKVIIQNIDGGTLMMSNGYEREQYLPYLPDDRALFDEIANREGFTWADRLLPLVRYAGYHKLILNGLTPRKESLYAPSHKGYIEHDSPWDGTVFSTIDTIDFTVNPEAAAIFEKYLQQCKQEGIEVVMVYAPIYIGVTKKMGSATDSMFAFYQRIANRYGYPILNYTYDSLSYDTLNFYNASHLNRRGAEQFSLKLAQDLKNLLQ